MQPGEAVVSAAERIRSFMDHYGGPVYFMFSGGSGSSVVLFALSTLPVHYHRRAVIVYVELVGNTSSVNVEAARRFFEVLFPGGRVETVEFYGRGSLGDAVSRCLPGPCMLHVRSFGRLGGFERFVARYGFVANRRARWCFSEFKAKVFRALPGFHREGKRWYRLAVSGMSAHDSVFRRSVSLESRFSLDGYWFIQLNPIYDFHRSIIFRIMGQYEVFGPILDVYRRFHDSLNCVVCPLRRASKQSAIFSGLKENGLCGEVAWIKRSVEERWKRHDTRRIEKEIYKAFTRFCGEG